MKYINKLKHSIKMLLLIAGMVPATAQTPQKSFNLNNTHSSTTTYDYEARDYVTLSDGFSVSPSSGNSFTASINESLLFDVEYLTGGDIPNPTSRSLNSTYNVGTTPGMFNVTSSGSAMYSVPIFVPPGTGGMKPNMSVTYNSNGGQGLLGKGWGISGISSIRRVQSTHYHDGLLDKVDYDLNDAFVLDGMRLIKDGSIFRTEHESYSTITPIENNGTISSFKVRTKDGKTIYYGHSEDSKIEDSNDISSTRYFAWYINKIQDSHGNYIEFHYHNENNEFFIEKIQYTGNDEANLEPYNVINFYYQYRDDKRSSFVYGTEMKHNVILRRIRCEAEGETVRSYDFKYVKDTDVTLLAELIEAGLNGEKYNSTVFNYHDYSEIAQNINTGLTDNFTKKLYGDVNGDGRTDLLLRSGSYVKYYKTNNKGEGVSYQSQLYIGTNDIDVGDFNGDGLDDLVAFTSSGIKWYKSTGTGFTYVSSSYVSLSGIDNIYCFDINGDYIDDIIVKRSSALNVYKGDTNDPFDDGFYVSFDWGDKHVFEDFNGDGKYDICISNRSKHRLYEFTSTGIYQFHNGTTISLTGDVVCGDFNGDGKADFIYGYNNLDEFTDVKIKIADGKTFVESNFNPTFDVPSDSIISYDEDGDGKHEIFAIRSGYLPLDPGLYTCKKYKYKNDNFEYVGFGTVNLNDKDMDFNGDGIKDGIYTSFEDEIFLQYFNKGNTKHRLHTIANGLNQRIFIEYKTIADTLVHTPLFTGGTTTVNNFSGSVNVVSKVKTTDGTGGYFENSYKYEGGKLFRPLGKFMGFSKKCVVSTETQHTNATLKNFHSTYPYVDTVINTILDNNDNSMRKSLTAYSISHISDKRVRKHPQYSTTNDYLNDRYDSTYIWTNTDGNVTHKKTYHGNAGTTDMYFENFTTVAGSPLPNVPQSVRVVKVRNGKPSYERKVNYSYNTTNGFVNWAKIDPTKSKELTIEFDSISNGLGLITKRRIEATDITTREEEFVWDSKGRYIVKSYTAENQITNYEYDHLTGNLICHQSPSGFITSYAYDGFGRMTYNSATDESFSREFYTSGTIPKCLYYHNISSDIQPDQTIYYDSLGREIQTEVEAYESTKTIVTKTSYNDKGQVSSTTSPYFENETSFQSTYLYDDYGRIDQKSYAGGIKTIDYTYGTNQVTITNTSISPNQSITKIFDDYGDIYQVKDDNNNTLTYAYNSMGNIDTIYTLDGNVVNEYDEYGRQTKQIEPDLGTTSYSYYSTGELKSSTKDGKTTSYTYNKNGQVKTLAENEGTITWNYDGNTGLIDNIDGINNNDVSYDYDDIGRVTNVTESINGTNYAFGYEYVDNYSMRLSKKTYPGENFAINYGYLNGYLDEIRNADGNGLIWELDETTPLNRVQKYTNGNNLVTTRTYNDKTGMINQITTGNIQDLEYDFLNATGNLNRRKDNKKSLQETFGYDNLNRLTSITTGSTTRNIAYADNGNISTLEDIGTYSYEADQPHAVSEINPSDGYLPDDHSATYTSFDKLSTLTQGNKSLNLYYGYDHERRRTVYSEGSTTKTKIFVPGGYEKITEGSTTKEFHYISTPAGITSVMEKTGTTENMFYIHPDYLGSVHLVTNASGSAVQELSYDAWGRQRNATDWTYNGTLPEPKFERGYTFHEQLTEFDLINMNGRIYDPFIARFMSPDPFTQDPGNLQGYNRYSYVLNNPMKYVDPSGYKTVSLELQCIINDLMSNSFPHGGSWNTQDGFVEFDNQEQTLNAGLGYLNQHASHTRRSRIVKSAYNHAVALRQSGLSMQVSASFTNETVTFSVDNGLIGINYVEGGDAQLFKRC